MPDPRRRAPDRPGRPLQPRRAQHPDRTTTPVPAVPRRRRTSPSCASSATSCAAAASAPCSRSRSVAQNGLGVERRPTAWTATFAFFNNLVVQHLLGARPGPTGVDGRRHELPRADGLRRRPLRRPARAAVVGDNFNPEVGFVRRDDMRAQLRAVPLQPAAARRCTSVRKFSWIGHRRPTSRTAPGGSRRATSTASSRSSSRTAIASASALHDDYEFLPAPFRIAPGVTLPVGGYDFDDGRVGYNFGQQRPCLGQRARSSTARSTTATGRRVGFSRGRVNLTPQFSVEPSVSINWVDLPRARSRPSWSARASPTR